MEDLLLTVARFATFAAGAFLFGLGPVYLLVLRRGFAAAADPRWRRGRELMVRRLGREADAAFVALVLAGLLVLYFQVVDAADRRGGGVGLGDLTAALQTRFGTWTALRLLLVVCMVFALRAQLRVRLGQDERTEDPQARVFWLAWLGFGAAVLATVTMSSHSAAGDRPALSLPVNLLHLLTSAVWLAGVCVLVTALPVALGTRRERIQVRLFAPTLASFARLAFRAVLLTALTGALNTLAVIGDFGGLRASSYGQALEVKVWLFLWILAFGGLNHFVLMRRLQAAGAGREGAGPMRSVAGGVSAELAFGVLLLASTAVLTGLSPP